MAIVAIVTAVVALAALAILAIALGPQLRHWDEDIHLGIARNLVSRGIFGYREMGSTAFEPPAYPLFVAAVVALADDAVAVRLAQVALLGATALLWAHIAARMFGEPAGAAAAALIVCYPPLAYGATAIYPQSLATFLVAALYALVFSGGGRCVIASGAALGALALTAPPYAVVALPLGFFLRRRGASWCALITAFAVAGTVVGVWTLRNAIVFDRFVPIATNGGSALLLGNAPRADARSGSTADITAYELWAPEADEFTNDRYFTWLALNRIGHEPVAVLRQYGAKLFHWFFPDNRINQQVVADWQRSVVTWLGYGALLGGTMLRVVYARRVALRAEEGCLILSYLIVAVTYAVFFTRVRYRIPVDPMLAVLAAGGCAIWLGDREGRSRSPSV